ncbi:MAG TPA: DUF1565 domain-containing protein [Thermosynechococcaceae cyanobacterium]
MLTTKLPLLLCTSALVSIGTIVLPSQPSANAETAANPLQQPSTSVPSQRPRLSVNPAMGNDATADGSDRAPFKTLTRALQVAQAGTIVELVSGLYSTETGEVFPLKLKSGVTLRGNRETRGQGIVIRGGGVFLSPTLGRQNVALVAANQAALVGVTVSNLEPGGYGLWVESASLSVTDSTFSASRAVGIAIVGQGAALIQNNYFEQNGESGLTIAGQANPQVRENIFENTGAAIVLQQSALPSIVGNRITQNQNGLVIKDNARPVLRNNSIEGNTRDGLVAIAQARPDLGTAAEPGGNVFRNNGQLDINATQSQQKILAVGNQIGKVEGPLDQIGLDQVGRSTAPNRPAIGTATSLTRLAKPAERSLPQTASAPSSDVSADSFPAPTELTPKSASPAIASSLAQPSAALIPPPPRIPTTSARPSLLNFVRSQPPVRSQPLVKPLPLTPAPQPVAPAIAIPVPPAAIAPLRPRRVSVSAPQPAAIAIPVPPPESRPFGASSIPSTAPRLALKAVQPGSPPSGANLLPVPNGSIPLGNVGTGSGVAVYRSSRAVSPPQATALRYRVVADTQDNRQQSQVQTLVPGAFWITLKGRSMMQLGAFGDRSRASELVQTLKSQGVAAAIEAIE